MQTPPAIEEAHRIRGTIISQMAYVEHLMSEFMAKHYAPINYIALQTEVLENPYFTFQLRKQILLTLLETKYPDIKFPREELERMQNIRNIAGHAAIVALTDGDGKNGVVLFRAAGKNHSPSELAAEMKQMESVVNPFLNSLPMMDLTSGDLEVTLG